MKKTKGLNQFQRLFRKRRDKARARYPLFFGLIASFGLAAVFYGFNELIKKIDILVDNPWIIFTTGVVLLLASGAAYKKLN